MTATPAPRPRADLPRAPQGLDDTAAYRYEEDGALLVGDGQIVTAAPMREVAAQARRRMSARSTTGRI